MDLGLGDLVGGYVPMVREDAPKVLDSKLDVKRIAALWARGVPPNEISEVLGMSDVLLSELMRSEEFSLAVNALLATREILSIEKALESSAVEALLTLRDLATNGENEAVKAKCAMYLVDQFRGKAPQHIKLSQGKVVEDPVAEAERLRKKIGYKQL